MSQIPDMLPPHQQAERHVLNYFNGDLRVVYLTDEEYKLNNGAILISRTDVRGLIMNGNPLFVEATGYQVNELHGVSHAILRHPDMPRSVFSELWQTILAGKEWHGYIKNLRKDGGYFWSQMTVVPTIMDNEITSFSAIRRKMSDELISKYSALYTGLCIRELNELKEQQKTLQEEAENPLKSLLNKKIF